MKQLISYLAALLVGAGVGYGVGMMISKPKLNQNQAAITKLEKQLTQSQTVADDAKKQARKAADEALQHKKNLSRSQAMVIKLTTDLADAKAKLAELKRQDQPVVPETVITTETQPAATPAETERTAPSNGRTVEYTVKDGDNLWDIAARELGNGLRYKEILKLNPGLTEKQALKIGMKLKLPAK